jgi:hypothetical protein
VTSIAAGGARPPVQAMIAFIDDHREAHGGALNGCERGRR